MEGVGRQKVEKWGTIVKLYNENSFLGMSFS